MGLPCFSIKFPTLIKDILVVLLSHLSLLGKVCSFKHGTGGDDYQPDDRPSPSLVPVPVHFIGDSIKKQLSIVQYSDFLKRKSTCKAKDSSVCVCVVCLNFMEASDEVRELCNCCHVFHKECLDVWIGEGRLTCPLCRSKLFPCQGEEVGLEVDPWRMQRMVYLFGEDYLLDTC